MKNLIAGTFSYLNLQCKHSMLLSILSMALSDKNHPHDI